MPWRTRLQRGFRGSRPGETIERYLTASDESGRTETLPRSAHDDDSRYRYNPLMVPHARSATVSSPTSVAAPLLAVASIHQSALPFW